MAQSLLSIQPVFNSMHATNEINEKAIRLTRCMYNNNVTPFSYRNDFKPYKERQNDKDNQQGHHHRSSLQIVSQNLGKSFVLHSQKVHRALKTLPSKTLFVYMVKGNRHFRNAISHEHAIGPYTAPRLNEANLLQKNRSIRFAYHSLRFHRFCHRNNRLARRSNGVDDLHFFHKNLPFPRLPVSNISAFNAIGLSLNK
jgi:hypothetical protein